ncbi:MAG: hypothetical protein B7Y93_01455 [Micrococcales bacterium 32-70-13]|nr:MAG: hypothetical protein B7Y93_01455 [Micrococcales bacterium 32-70-13]
MTWLIGRALTVERVAQGRPVAHVAAELGVSRQATYRGVRRFPSEGVAGLRDRSSRPRFPSSRSSARPEAPRESSS